MSLQNPIFITGCPRSGNSMVAGITYLCGAFGGNMGGSSKFTRTGSFQNVEIRQRIVRAYMMKGNWDIRGQDPLPTRDELLSYDNLKSEVEMIIQFQGCGNERWFYKDTALSLMWPLWNQAFPDANWIIVRRDRSEIAKSCLKTGYMRAFENQTDWERWASVYEQRFEEMKENGLNVVEVWPSKFLSGDLSDIACAIRKTGLPFKDKKVVQFLDVRQGGSNGQ